jgi:uncharacterized membrane protein YagU involved in acid resistance
MKSPFRKMLAGAAAGLIATAPMTAFMQAAWRRLPASDRHTLPPRKITRKIARQLGIRWPGGEKQQISVTLLSHFGFGALAGSAYGMVEDQIPLGSSFKGALAGLAVWTASYLGWIPALRILPPATKHSWRRNLLMIVAHLVWGTALGVLTRRMKPKKQYIDLD